MEKMKNNRQWVGNLHKPRQLNLTFREGNLFTCDLRACIHGLQLVLAQANHFKACILASAAVSHFNTKPRPWRDLRRVSVAVLHDQNTRKLGCARQMTMQYTPYNKYFSVEVHFWHITV